MGNDEIIAENNFLSWLSDSNSPRVEKSVIDSFRTVNNMLLRKKAINQSLVLITEKEPIEYALNRVKDVFGDKQLRNKAVILLDAYISYLYKLTNKSNQRIENEPTNIDNAWVRFNSQNSQLFERTIPIYCNIRGKEFTGKNWARILTAIVENEIASGNPKLTSLYHRALLNDKNEKPFFLKDKIDGLNFSHLSNGYWINVNWSIPRLMKLIWAFCLKCGYQESEIIIYGIPKSYREKTEKSKDSLPDNISDKFKTSQPDVMDMAHDLENSDLQKIEEAIRIYYSDGFRFDETVIKLLESRIGQHINHGIMDKLRIKMFRRNDDLFFMPETIGNEEQQKVINREKLLEEIDTEGCITVTGVYERFCSMGSCSAIRNETDFEDYLTFLLPEEIKIRSAFKHRVIRKRSSSFENSISFTVRKAVEIIKTSGCVTEDELLSEFPGLSASFLHEILTKKTDEVIQIYINEYLCYQSLESIEFNQDITKVLEMVFNEIVLYSLTPTEDVVHALLSVKLGANFKEEYGVSETRTFQRIVSMYYSGKPKRVWKSGCFVEVEE